MSTERPEFRPIEATPARRNWPFALLGAALVACLVYIARHERGAPEKAVALANVAGLRADVPAAPALPAQAPEAARAASSGAAPAQRSDGPNVLGAVQPAPAGKSLAMVARSELDRELGRTKNAQKEAAAARQQAQDLQRQLAEARNQIAALQRSKAPPPPSDQEQILQTLAPVLRAGNEGGTN